MIIESILRRKWWIFYLAVLMLAQSPAVKASSLVVKTYPDGIHDDGIAYLYKDQISTFSFYLYTPDEPGDIYKVADNPVEMEGVNLFIRLPKGMDIVSYGLVHGAALISSHTRYQNMKKTEEGDFCRWELACEKGPVRYKFRAGRWGTDTKSVASRYHIYLYLEPQPGFTRDAFDMEWAFKRGATTEAQGTARVKLLPGPKDRKNPKRFMVWTGFGSNRNILGERELESFLDLARECGVTGLIQAGIPFTIKGEFEETTRAKVRARGFTLIDMDAIKAGLALRRGEEGPKNAENYTVDLTDTRATNSPVSMWCPTMLATPGSEVFEKMTAELKKRYQDGVRFFYIDFERSIYSQCFCAHCRASFARYINAGENEIRSLKACDLIYKYPLEWYKFRSWQTGNFFKAWKAGLEKDCPDIMLGLNENISYPGVYTRGLGYGMIWFCEDPRFTDPGLDFHNTDTIKGGMEDIIRLDLWFRPQDSCGVKITKPVIARAGAFCNVSWNHFCTLSGKAWADERKEPFGCDKRGELLKLAIANMAALGAKGVEISLSSDITDALVANAADKGVAFVAEFEDILLDGQRLDDKQVEIYNLTTESSPYDKIGPKSYYDQTFFYGPAKNYGFIRYKAHQVEKDQKVSFFNWDFFRTQKQDRLVSIFNWDFYQTKKLLVKIPGLKDGAYFVCVYNNGVRCRLSRGNKETWGKDELARGISLDLEGGGVAGIYVSETPLEGYANVTPDKGYSAAGKSPIDLYAWRGPIPAEPTIREFEECIYNKNLTRIRKGRPEAVPEKYLKSTP